MRENNKIVILWDFGGVLTKSPFLKIKNFEKKNNIPINSIIKINSSNPFNNAWAKLEKNLISFEKFSQYYIVEAEKLGIKNIKPLKLLECLETPLNKKMVNLLSAVSKKFFCACLTNNFKDFYSVKNKKNFDSIKNNFKLIFESSKIGYRKPDREIYYHVLNKLNTNPNNIIFIDDLGINLKPAREIGFVTYKHTRYDCTFKFLKNKLGLYNG